MSSRQSEMSDNDYSDIEVDIETTPSDGNPNVADHKKHARAQHNALERRRRDNIKDMYTHLKDEIPNFSHERASRAQILAKAIEELHSVAAEVEDLTRELQETEEEKERLQRKAEELEAAEASCRTTPERET